MITGNQYFYLPQPAEGDKRPRNVWGVLKGFGKAYSRYYVRRDKCQAGAVPHNIEVRFLGAWSVYTHCTSKREARRAKAYYRSRMNWHLRIVSAVGTYCDYPKQRGGNA
jgi:hypothetical protein